MVYKNQNGSPRSLREAGATHLLILVAVIGFIAFILISRTAEFKNRIFSALFPKPPSKAAQPFSVGMNVTGIIHFGYQDANPFCSSSVGYSTSGQVPPVTSGGGSNIYADLAAAGTMKVTATGDLQCSGHITPNFGSGLSNCTGACGTGGVTDGCTCSGGNPKDGRACWWRWTCDVSSSGTATYDSIFLEAPASHIDADLLEMQRMGAKIIRIFAANKYISDTEAAQRLNNFLVKAQSYGISVIVAFIDYYNSGFSPQGISYSRCTFNPCLLGSDFFTTGYQGRYKQFVQTVVEMNKSMLNIYAWEIGNELRYEFDSTIFINFMNDVTSFIKSIDPSHKVATGMLRAGHTGLTAATLYPQLPQIEIVTVHPYNGDRSGLEDVQWSNSNSKEVMIEEFGIGGTSDRSSAVTTELNYWKSQGVSSFLQWGFIAKGLTDSGNGDSIYGMDTIWHTDYDQLFTLYKQANPSPIPSPTPPPGKLGDINGDGSVNVIDFSILLSKWNTTDASADLNKDGIVNIVDFSVLLSNWGT